MSLWSPLTRVHFAPASEETNRPPCSLLESLSMRAYTLLGFARDTAMAIFPFAFGRPLWMGFQVSPPSTDLYKPLPLPPEITFHGFRICSHIAAYNTCGLCTSILSSLAPLRELVYRVFFHVFPPSVVLYTPLLSAAPCKGP